MAGVDPRIDAYIARAQPFARPILEWVRAQFHAACPAVGETIKWSSPHFTLHDRPFAMMAAFKAHAAFGFWRYGEVTETGAPPASAMGQFGRLTAIADLPPEAEFRALIVKAAAIAAEGQAAPRPRKHPKPDIATPAEIAAAFAADPEGPARAAWDGFPPSARRDYAEWIEGAKRAETRARRAATTLAQLADGKRLNWRYEKPETPKKEGADI